MDYLEKKLMEFSLRLIDENKAKIIVPVFTEEGYWFGGGNMVEDEELFHIVQGSRDIVEAGEMLVEAAKENGGTDNIGVVLFEPFADEVSV